MASFRLDEQRIRTVHGGDPLVNANGERIGWVICCAVDAEHVLAGQAYLENGYTKQETPIGIHKGGVMDRPTTSARVVSKFPKLWRLKSKDGMAEGGDRP